MGTFNSLTIDPTPTEPTVDPLAEEEIHYNLYRHALLARQVPGYIGGATHARIREQLAKRGVIIS